MHDATALGEILKILVIAGIALFTFIRKALSASSEKPAVQPESEAARRAREEIRRKIAERRGGQAPPAPANPPPVPQRRFASPTEAPRPVMSGAGNTLQDVLRERLRRREEAEARRLADLRQAALEEARPAQPVVAPVLPEAAPRRLKVVPLKSQAGATLTAASLAGELSDSDALRRAFVMNEILSAPLALRGSRTTAW